MPATQLLGQLRWNLLTRSIHPSGVGLHVLANVVSMIVIVG